MKHIDSLTASMYSDGALASDQQLALEQHLKVCSSCQQKVSQFKQQQSAIQLALNDYPAPVMPAFAQPLRLGELIPALLGISVLCLLVRFIWSIWFSDTHAEVLSWFINFHPADLFGFSASAVMYFIYGDNSMLQSLMIAVVSIILLSGVFILQQEKWARAQFMVLLLAMGVYFSPNAVSALEHRHDDNLTSVMLSETINDTLIIAGQTVVIDGKVLGDVVAVGERVIINGEISGNLITLGESTTVAGKVSGSLLSLGETVELSEAQLGGDFWGFASRLKLAQSVSLGRNAVLFSEKASIAAQVQKDLFGFGETIELDGDVGRNMEAFANRVVLLGKAKVGGDLTFRTDDAERLQMSPSAEVVGAVDIQPWPFESQPKNEYLSVSFYVQQMLYLVGAFIIGVMLLWLFPSLRQIQLAGGMASLKTVGSGLLVLLVLPFMVLLMAVTIVGLPLAFISLVAGVCALYFAKIVVALIIGRMLVTDAQIKHGLLVTLLAGLAVVVVAINLPVVGGVFNFLLTLAGLGILLQQLTVHLSQLQFSSAA